MAARSWKAIRADGVAAGRISEKGAAKAKDAMRKEVVAHKLVELRKLNGLSQKVLAKEMGVAQPRVSAIENGRIENTEYGTLKSYIEGIGGKIKIVADFGDQSIVVQDS